MLLHIDSGCSSGNVGSIILTILFNQYIAPILCAIHGLISSALVRVALNHHSIVCSSSLASSFDNGNVSVVIILILSSGELGNIAPVCIVIAWPTILNIGPLVITNIFSGMSGQIGIIPLLTGNHLSLDDFCPGSIVGNFGVVCGCDLV